MLAWCETWLAHDMAYRLLAEMRIALFNKLDTLAPAYLLRRRSGDLVSLATQDVETVESFFAHTITPSIVAVLVPTAIVVTLAGFGWPTALVLLPFLLYVGLTPIFVRRRIDRLGAAAREGLGRMTAHVTDTIQGLSELVAFQAIAPRRADFLRIVGDYHELRLTLYRDLSMQSAALEVATGLGGLGVAIDRRLSGDRPASSIRPCCRCSPCWRWRRSCRSPRSPMSAASSPTRSPRRIACRKSIASGCR